MFTKRQNEPHTPPRSSQGGALGGRLPCKQNAWGATPHVSTIYSIRTAAPGQFICSLSLAGSKHPSCKGKIARSNRGRELISSRGRVARHLAFNQYNVGAIPIGSILSMGTAVCFLMAVETQQNTGGKFFFQPLFGYCSSVAKSESLLSWIGMVKNECPGVFVVSASTALTAQKFDSYLLESLSSSGNVNDICFSPTLLGQFPSSISNLRKAFITTVSDIVHRTTTFFTSFSLGALWVKAIIYDSRTAPGAIFC